jgi:hypothetical protein
MVLQTGASSPGNTSRKAINMPRLVTLTHVSLGVARIAALFLPCAHGYGADGAADRAISHSISFESSSLGGVMTFGGAPRRTAEYVTITNQAGDSAEDVAFRLMRACNESAPFATVGRAISVDGGALELGGFRGRFLIGGSERGLGIPLPPASLSGFYDPRNDEVSLAWDNPTGRYTYISVSCNGMPIAKVGGDAESFIHRRVSDSLFFRDIDLDYCVVGHSGDVPSNGGVPGKRRSSAFPLLAALRQTGSRGRTTYNLRRCSSGRVSSQTFVMWNS